MAICRPLVMCQFGLSPSSQDFLDSHPPRVEWIAPSQRHRQGRIGCDAVVLPVEHGEKGFYWCQRIVMRSRLGGPIAGGVGGKILLPSLAGVVAQSEVLEDDGSIEKRLGETRPQRKGAVGRSERFRKKLRRLIAHRCFIKHRGVIAPDLRTIRRLRLRPQRL